MQQTARETLTSPAGRQIFAFTGGTVTATIGGILVDKFLGAQAEALTSVIEKIVAKVTNPKNHPPSDIGKEKKSRNRHEDVARSVVDSLILNVFGLVGNITAHLITDRLECGDKEESLEPRGKRIGKALTAYIAGTVTGTGMLAADRQVRRALITDMPEREPGSPRQHENTSLGGWFWKNAIFSVASMPTNHYTRKLYDHVTGGEGQEIR